MNSGDFPKERRQFPRFRVKERAFVVFGLEQPKLGQIINIGPNGLAFRYLVDGAENVGSPRTVDLMMRDTDFYLDRLPVVVVNDREEETLPLATTMTRIASLQFGSLSPDQKFRLESFLNRQTAPLAPLAPLNA